MSSITYSERIKIETFCELGLSNIQMGVQLNVVVMNALIGIYVIFILKGLVLSTLVLKI